MVKRNMRALTYAEAMALVLNGGFATTREMGKGWFVWATSAGNLCAHNPYHGAGPSGRDHEFRASELERKANWFEVKL